MSKTHDLVLVGEAAKILGKSPDTVRRLERLGTLTATRVGGMRQFRRSDVERLAKAREAATN